VTNKLQRESTAKGQELNGLLRVCDGILCFGGEDWWYHNQAHFDMQIMRCMARRLPVLFINSVGFRMPSPTEGTQFIQRVGRKLRSITRPISSPFPNLHVASPISVPLWHRPFLANLNVLSVELQVRKACRVVGLKNPLLWVACPTAFEVAKRLQQNSFLVYQRTDKFEEYSEQAREYFIAADRWLSGAANLVLYASTVLYEEEQHRARQRLLVQHGVELTHFDPIKALEKGQPSDLANIKRPIVGFFGEIEDNAVDLPLVGEAARALPHASFVFVGQLVADPSPVRGLPNVHFLGKKTYEEVPRYGAHFDVALMPLKNNRWKYYANPIKLKEYLALGLPVVSTEFPEAIYYKDVFYVASSGADFIQGIREALGTGGGVGSVDSRRARVAGDTWEQATQRIIDAIRNKGDTRLCRHSDAAQEEVCAPLESHIIS
jgi:glycosyltransferase involved in cell wall biosynthesis